MNTPDTIELGGFTFVRDTRPHLNSVFDDPPRWLIKDHPQGPSIFLFGTKYVAGFKVGPAQITFESPTPEGLNDAWAKAVQDTYKALGALFAPPTPPATKWDPTIAVVTKER